MRLFFTRLFFFALLWWVLSEGRIKEPAFPVIVVVTLALAANYFWPENFVRWRLSSLVTFIPYFMLESLRGGLDVSLRALRPSLPLMPGFVTYNLKLNTEAARVFFTWIVSLLPGTASVKLEGEALLIHLLDTSAPIMPRLEELESRVAKLMKDEG